MNATPGSALSAMRRTTWHICPVCGASFLALARAKFCSNRCKQADKYARQKATAP
jgi:predicted nucleic acid-binding Zn ribbon protein